MKSTLALLLPVVVLLLALPAGGQAADLQLAPVFSAHMVLQREMPVAVWGTADRGEKVIVEFAGQRKAASADAAGQWRVKLDAMPASAEPRELRVSSDAIESRWVTVADVLVGEVWLGSGQSNMAGTFHSFAPKDEGLQKLVAAAPYPRIRLLKSDGTGWQEATPANVPAFSAILFAFGAGLQKELNNVPVGLMLGAVGGTPSGYWLTEEMYRGDAACQAQVKEFARTYDFDAATKSYERLAAAWKETVEKAKLDPTIKVGRAPAPPQQAGECAGVIGHLYAQHIQRYVSYTLRGVLWDQGESGTAITGVDQFHVMGALIHGWREAWGQDFPFLYIQKPSGGGTAWDFENPVTKDGDRFTPLPKQVPSNIDGLAREVHLKIQRYPHTAMVTSTDLGGGTHPVNKAGYAARAVRVAMGFVYGKPGEISGPLYASHAIEGGKVSIRFSHVGQGLAARHSDQLQGFMIAGADRKFHWAEATIEGDHVIVSSPEVAQPVAVRYAWSSRSPWANLFNQDGLPAQTFRTDDWK